MGNTTIVWFRRDLRLQDNPAWNHALHSDGKVIPVYIHCPKEEGKWPRGEASMWWLHRALEDLANQLDSLNCPLVIKNSSSASLSALQDLIDESGAQSVVWNRCYEPAMATRDTTIKQTLTEAGIFVESFNGSLLLDPLKIKNKSGTPFKVFTPFWKHCSAQEIEKPSTTRKALSPHHILGDSLTDLNLMPNIPWYRSMDDFWTPTRAGGLKLLKVAVKKAPNYLDTRDIPEDDGTSRLSPYLHFGQIGPREFYHTILNQCSDTKAAEIGMVRQLFWREFSAHLLYHFPHSSDTALKEEYDHFPWKLDADLLRKWQRGDTGYPIVDAGMRQLWQTGWMHNRVRMIAASLLVKHLLQPWQEGAYWFWDTLVDADLPNNTMGWQWIAGSGADASPYFRIFNPIIQGKKFDPNGTYIRRWIPKLSKLPNEAIHTPWELESLELEAAGVRLGNTYPEPIVPHQEGRSRALAAYQQFKEMLEDL
ncbi:MAG: cryptochrome/photolyase family protein [Akkermansiaceae bacterium]